VCGQKVRRDVISEIVGRAVSHYRVLRQIGGVGMGVVFEAEGTRLGRRATDTRLNRDLAIKILLSSAWCASRAGRRSAFASQF
jgi:hypothetical protein